MGQEITDSCFVFHDIQHQSANIIMLGTGWLTLKQAHEALRTGRLDEAQQLLMEPHIQGHKRCLELLQELMRAYVARGEKCLAQNDPTAAWSDLLKAEQIGITDDAPIRLRRELTRLGLAEVGRLLEAGEPTRAIEVLAQLRQRAVRYPDMDNLEEGAKDWANAQGKMEQGEFAQALQTLDRAERLLPAKYASIEKFRQKLEENNRTTGPLLMELHDAAQNQHWNQVLAVSEKILAKAPQHNDARRLRSRAWKSIEPPTVAPMVYNASPPEGEKRAAPEKRSNRFILWIDGVGGFLVCMDNRITLGQAGPECLCDVPILADVSRMHASLTRDSEGYVFEASRTSAVNNVPVTKKLLQSGERLTLGASCQLKFSQDVPISTSARLDLVSGHRFGQAVDYALLMAETLVLGPGSQVHVAMPITAPLIIYRNKGHLGIRCTEKFWVNGHAAQGRADLDKECSVTGNDFSFALETL